MSIVQASCSACGNRFRAKRATAKFCSTKCRMRASRNTDTRQGIITALAQRGLIGKVWPTMKSDKSPPIYALMVPRSTAVTELNFAATGTPITDAELVAAMRFKGILDHTQPVPVSVTNPGSRSNPTKSRNRYAKRAKNPTKSMAKNRDFAIGRSQKKGPAAAPTAPSRGSLKPNGRENEHGSQYHDEDADASGDR